jgi:hypothetical protein
MAYKVEGITPYSMPEGTVQFPVYWMDDICFRHEGDKPSIPELVDTPGLKVFDFHPPHVFFNTPSWEYYSKYKNRYWAEQPDLTDRHEGYGVRKLFVELLEYISNHGIEAHTLGELYADYKS